jgi:hypothetical protein
MLPLVAKTVAKVPLLAADQKPKGGFHASGHAALAAAAGLTAGREN